jgi:exo-beta-1,3-glucanase (GH17 family)
MRKFLSIAATLFAAALTANTSMAAVQGINYDPAHSAAYNNARNSGNVAGMIAAINADLDKIKAMGFTHIKTFYSTFCTDAPQCVPIAQLTKQKNLKLLMGVYEFRKNNGCGAACPQWTAAQVQAAIDSARNYPGTIVGIVVGNEDMFDDGGNAQLDLQQRIATDIQTLKNNLSLAQSGIITTAQRQPDWPRLKANDRFNVLSKIDTIGANFYPFWGGSPEKLGSGLSVATIIQPQAVALAAQMGRKVIITEEGWPSCGNNPGKRDMNIDSQVDYYRAWRFPADAVDSYYFAAFDKKDATGCATSGDADAFFGLCTAAGTTKDTRLCNCDAPTSACATGALVRVINRILGR